MSNTPDIRDLELYADTDQQREYIALVKRLDSVTHAATEKGISVRCLSSILARLRNIRDAVEVGAEPADARYVLPGQKVIGMSTMVKTEEGHPQWIKTKEDKEAAEEELQAIREAFASSLARAKPVKRNKLCGPDELLNLHILTDFHLSQYSWREESGEDWDMAIAEQLLLDWFAYAIKRAPPAQTGILAQLGDLLHVDGLEALTPTGKNLLDADSRFQKVVRVAIRLIRAVVTMMLKKYDHVHMLMADANHDPASSAWMREVFYAFYEDDPRITVDRSPDTYYCYEHGKTSLFFHHGHRRKPTNIDDVFTAKFREVFGRTKHSYAHMGHMHHKQALETNLMLVEQHRTMAAKDAYASSRGWMAGRSAPVITYHKEYGEIGRLEVTPKMVQPVP